ncbi:hypothetical protein [Vibrio sp. ER1A]|uniref:hypothetical protein n=1 Tax=Vibrio sp. ER1A TaxID=1517681 RepID=UPI0006892B76|nr:hypothetical protein [Vibrio sp. ER1A]
MTVSLVNYTDTSIFTADEQEILAHAADILKSKLIISEQPALTAANLVKAFCQTSLFCRTAHLHHRCGFRLFSRSG